MESTITTKKNYTLYIKDKYGVYFVQPFVDQNSKLLNVEKATVVYSSNNLSALIVEGKVFIYDNNTLELLKQLEEYELVSQIHFSPSGRYLVIIQKPSVQNNLKIIDLNDFQTKMAFHSTTHPSAQWPQIKFSTQEDYIFKLQKGQLDIYKIANSNETSEDNSEDKSEGKYGGIDCIIKYDISEISIEQLKETAIICGRVVLDEKTKKKKSLVSFYKLSDLTKPVKEMSVSISDRMNIKVSPDKKCVLVQSISDDTSNKSYYGESTLYYMDLLYGKFQKLNLPEGPIHDFEWTPNGNNFVVCSGHQPSKTFIYSNQAKFLKEICVSKVSTVRISPDSRILCLAGFGNLNGDLEIYRLSDLSLIGKNKLYCGVSLNWSQNSQFLLGAVLSPRIRVDNEYKIFTYNGEELLGEKFNGEIYECEWLVTKGIEYEEFNIAVSQVYLAQKKEMEKKAKEKSLAGSLNSLDISSNKNKGIPGLKKK